MSELDDAINRLASLPETKREASGAKVNCSCTECNGLRACRKQAIEDCTKAARAGFERAMADYTMIGPGGIAAQMINSIRALL